MWFAISSWVPSSEPVSAFTRVLMCAAFRTIMFRQIAGSAVLGLDTVLNRIRR